MLVSVPKTSVALLNSIAKVDGKLVGRAYGRGVKLIFPGGHISLTLAFKGSKQF